MHPKNSQVTLFIILGITLIVIMTLFFNILPRINNKEEVIPSTSFYSIDAIKGYIQSCVYNTGVIALQALGIKGGYISKPKYVFKSDDLTTSYLYFSGENILPEIYEIENNLSSFMDYYLPLCVNWSLFNNFEISKENVKTKTIIREDSLIFDVEWPIKLETSKNIVDISDFRTEIPFDFLKYYRVVSGIVRKTELDPTYIDHVYLLSQFMNITYSIYDNSSVLYLIKDIEKDEFDYSFLFATKINIS